MKYLLSALKHPRDYRWLELRPWQRHSTVLVVAGLVYVAFGVTLMLTDPEPTRTTGLRFALSMMPLNGWGAVWITVGGLAVLSARWPPASKTWGYTALSLLAMFWGGVYALSVAFFDAPSNDLRGAIVWGLVVFLWWAIAGLTNPDDLRDVVDDVLTRDDCGSSKMES